MKNTLIIIQTEEQFLSSLGYGRGDHGDAGLHIGNSSVSRAAKKASMTRLAADAEDWQRGRDAGRTRYAQRVAAGQVRQPTRKESLILQAGGDTGKASVQAAIRLCEKRGWL